MRGQQRILLVSDIDLNERVPNHSMISQLRRRKPSFRKVFQRLFEEVVRQCVEKRVVSGKLIATDSTHVKANASRASEDLVEVQEEPRVYWRKLERRNGKRRKKRTKQVKRDKRRTHKRVSRTTRNPAT